MKIAVLSPMVLCIAAVALCDSTLVDDPNLEFKQNGKDLIITGTGWATAGRRVVQTSVKRPDEKTVILQFRVILNRNTIEQHKLSFPVSWTLKDTTKGDQKYLVEKLTTIDLSESDLKQLLGEKDKPTNN